MEVAASLRWIFFDQASAKVHPRAKLESMIRLAIALILTIALGIVSRLRPLGWSWYDHSLGDVLYAVAVYLALALVFRLPRRIVAPLALVICLAVEFFQATGIPAQYGHLAIVRWLIGTTFSW